MAVVDDGVRMLTRLAGAAGVPPVLLFSGFGEPSKHEIVEKVECAETKGQPEKALGTPDDIGQGARWRNGPTAPPTEKWCSRSPATASPWR